MGAMSGGSIVLLLRRLSAAVELLAGSRELLSLRFSFGDTAGLKSIYLYIYVLGRGTG